MAKKKYEEANIEAIADTIREKTGTEKTYKTKDMAEGVGEVFEAGKRAEYDMFWDAVTHNWTRTDYRWGLRWKCQYIRPPRKIIPTGSQGICYMFCDNPDLLKIEKAYFDFSKKSIPNQTAGYYGNQRVFANCRNLVEIEDIGMQAAYYDGTFYDCLNLEKIEIIRSQEDTLYNNEAFGYCSKLKDLVVEGVIGTNFNIRYSPLSIASLKSIIKHLNHYYGTADEFKYTLTVKASAWEALEAAGFTDEDYQWVIDNWNSPPASYDSWETLMGGWLGWNLVLA